MRPAGGGCKTKSESVSAKKMRSECARQLAKTKHIFLVVTTGATERPPRGGGRPRHGKSRTQSGVLSHRRPFQSTRWCLDGAFGKHVCSARPWVTLFFSVFASVPRGWFASGWLFGQGPARGKKEGRGKDLPHSERESDIHTFGWSGPLAEHRANPLRR